MLLQKQRIRSRSSVVVRRALKIKFKRKKEINLSSNKWNMVLYKPVAERQGDVLGSSTKNPYRKHSWDAKGSLKSETSGEMSAFLRCV